MYCSTCINDIGVAAEELNFEIYVMTIVILRISIRSGAICRVRDVAEDQLTGDDGLRKIRHVQVVSTWVDCFSGKSQSISIPRTRAQNGRRLVRNESEADYDSIGAILQLLQKEF